MEKSGQSWHSHIERREEGRYEETIRAWRWTADDYISQNQKGRYCFHSMITGPPAKSRTQAPIQTDMAAKHQQAHAHMQNRKQQGA